MDLGIKGRIALVTASSQGLGKGVATQLAAEKAKVIICSRNEEKLNKARDEIVFKTKGSVTAYPVDITDHTQVREMIKKIIAEFGTIDILVCNAGGPPSGSIENFSVADFRKALELNLISTINLCTEIYPFLQKNRWGRIVAITSVSAKQPIDNLVLSNTARSGVTGYIKTLSNHLASFGITVNSICPGYTKTERVEQLAEAFEQNGKGSVSTFYRNIENSIPMKRLGTTEEFAKTVAFLVSEGAGYITGSALQVDGGFVKNIL